MTEAERNELIEAHLKLADLHARKTYYRTGRRLSLDDLMQVARIGLIRAAERFKPELGLQFQTYADHKVRGAIADWIRRESGRRRSKLIPDPPTLVSIDALLAKGVELADSRSLVSAIEARKDLETLKRRLPVTPKNVRRWRVLDALARGWTVLEIATRERLTTTQVWAIAFAGKTALRSALRKRSRKTLSRLHD